MAVERDQVSHPEEEEDPQVREWNREHVHRKVDEVRKRRKLARLLPRGNGRRQGQHLESRDVKKPYNNSKAVETTHRRSEGQYHDADQYSRQDSAAELAMSPTRFLVNKMTFKRRPSTPRQQTTHPSRSRRDVTVHDFADNETNQSALQRRLVVEGAASLPASPAGSYLSLVLHRNGSTATSIASLDERTNTPDLGEGTSSRRDQILAATEQLASKGDHDGRRRTGTELDEDEEEARAPPAELRLPARSNTLDSLMLRQTDRLHPRSRSEGGRLIRRLTFRGNVHRKTRRGPLGDEDDLDEEEDNILFQALENAGLLDEEIPEGFEREYLWENQRGFYLLGLRYSPLALGPWDPSPWTRLDGVKSSNTKADFPLPPGAWTWYHAHWLADMRGDVDSQGWQYSTRFGSKYWRGIPDVRFLVRRRLWTRLRYRPAVSAQKVAKDTEVGTVKESGTAPLEGRGRESGPDSEHNRSARQLRRLSGAGRFALINPYNPFLSWYRESGMSEMGNDRSGFKDDLVRQNFERVSGALVRKTLVDRARIGRWEWWLGLCQPCDLKEVEWPADHPEESQSTQKLKFCPDRPDIRDVWDLLERRLDDLLQLFEYQESRRTLLNMLTTLHNSSHAEHHYKNRSQEQDAPAELKPVHEHGHSSGGPKPHDPAYDVHIPRLEFWNDVHRRLNNIELASSTTSLSEQP